MTAKRTVEHNGVVYKVKSDTVEIPNLRAMDGIAAALWLIKHTYRRGYSIPKPLAGLAGAVSLGVRS